MASKQILSSAVAFAATLSVAALAGCPATNPVGTPSSSAKPSASTSATPAPTGSATPAPVGSGGATPTPAPTGLPSTTDTSGNATITGSVLDDLGNQVDGITVTGKVLGARTFSNGSDTLVTTTQIGSYALNGAPTGSTILITVGKDGYTTRQQTLVPLSNLQRRHVDQQRHLRQSHQRHPGQDLRRLRQA